MLGKMSATGSQAAKEHGFQKVLLPHGSQVGGTGRSQMSGDWAEDQQVRSERAGAAGGTWAAHIAVRAGRARPVRAVRPKHAESRGET